MTLRDRRPPNLRHLDRLYVGGAWVEPATTSTIEVVDPATEVPYYRVAEAHAPDVDAAVTAARAAFDGGSWPRAHPTERAAHLRAMAAALARRGEDVGELWARQAGAVYDVATQFAIRMAGLYDRYAGLADTFAFEQEVPAADPTLSGLLVREPVGVVGAIVPWNVPLGLTALKVAPALLAGCTVVLKLSPEAPGEGYVLAEVAEEVGLPPGVLNVLTADREASELLVRDPRVDKISFTGSTAAGRRIASICGERVARFTLELGGKSAAVVLDDMDLEEAARSLADQERFNAGQVCLSLTRIVVSQHRHDRLAEALAAAFSRVRVGDPLDSATEMGPLATRRQRDRVLGYVEQGVAAGAKLLTGGGRPAHLDRGWYVEPTVFAGVDNGSTIAQEEIFGPVLSVIPAADERDAVRIANDSVYGLNAAVYTHDAERARWVARALRTGTVGQNGCRTDTGIAVGGYKQSGIGREGGVEGLLPYLETKTVLLSAPTSPAGAAAGTPVAATAGAR